MPSVTKIQYDNAPRHRLSWQLLKDLQVVQTAVTAAKLSQELTDVSFAEAFQVADVSFCRQIAIQGWGTAADSENAVLQFYCWPEFGPGFHMGTITVEHVDFTSAADTGWHASDHAPDNIKNSLFLPGTAYRGLGNEGATEPFIITNDYTASLHSDKALLVPSGEVDFPGVMVVSFHNTRPKYLGVAATTVTGTSIGLIYKPLDFWNEQTSW